MKRQSWLKTTGEIIVVIPFLVVFLVYCFSILLFYRLPRELWCRWFHRQYWKHILSFNHFGRIGKGYECQKCGWHTYVYS